MTSLARKRKRNEGNSEQGSVPRIDRSKIQLQNIDWLAPTAHEFHRLFPDIGAPKLFQT